jgi:hypothetical protein
MNQVVEVLLVFIFYEESEMKNVFDKFLREISIDALKSVFVDIISKLPMMETDVKNHLLTDNNDIISLICRDKFG